MSSAVCFNLGQSKILSSSKTTNIAFVVFRQPGSRWALEQAKYNLINNYLLVGVTEELQDFIAMLEVTLPRFFKGALDLYHYSM